MAYALFLASSRVAPAVSSPRMLASVLSAQFVAGRASGRGPCWHARLTGLQVPSGAAGMVLWDGPHVLGLGRAACCKAVLVGRWPFFTVVVTWL